MPPIFTEYKTLIDAFLSAFLSQKSRDLDSVNRWGSDLVGRITPLVVAGKTIRGSLAVLSYCFTNEKPSENAIRLGAALELLQTALVVHDDIMDKDAVRRGKPSLHVQYKSESMAMCAGDVLFFLAFEVLGSIETDPLTLGRLIRLIGREYQYVGVAQMDDVTPALKTKEEMLSLYTYKTARYTFAVPLMLGAVLAQTSRETLKYLESYGVSAGVLFQIRDDELDHDKNLFTKQDIDGFHTAAQAALGRLTIEKKHTKMLGELLTFVTTRTK